MKVRRCAEAVQELVNEGTEMCSDCEGVSSLFFFSLLFRQLADNEALIIFLQTSLFLVSPYAVDNCMCLSSKSSLTLSIHLFLRLPLLLSPLTCPCSA